MSRLYRCSITSSSFKQRMAVCRCCRPPWQCIATWSIWTTTRRLSRPGRTRPTSWKTRPSVRPCSPWLPRIWIPVTMAGSCTPSPAATRMGTLGWLPTAPSSRADSSTANVSRSTTWCWASLTARYHRRGRCLPRCRFVNSENNFLAYIHMYDVSHSVLTLLLTKCLIADVVKILLILLQNIAIFYLRLYLFLSFI